MQKKTLNTSVGRKYIMSLSGLFLIIFLAVHLATNMLLLMGDEVYNQAVQFMGSNPAIQFMRPVLALGVLVHIAYGGIVTYLNRKARPVGYAVTASNGASDWSSRNMFVLGLGILIFLGLHISHFTWKMQFGEIQQVSYDQGVTYMKDAYSLVSGVFICCWWYNVLYIAAAMVLGFHLSHGFWSAFQSVGLSNQIWFRRLRVIGYIYAALIALGFSSIPLYFWLFAS